MRVLRKCRLYGVSKRLSTAADCEMPLMRGRRVRMRVCSCNVDFRQAVYEAILQAKRIVSYAYIKVRGTSAYCCLRSIVRMLASSTAACCTSERVS